MDDYIIYILLLYVLLRMLNNYYIFLLNEVPVEIQYNYTV